MQSLRELYKIGYGPSSSHTIAPGRAAKMFIDKHPTIKSFRVTLYGSLAATGVGHGTDKVIETVIKPLDVEIIWKPDVELPLHPNGLLFEAIEGDKAIDAWEVYSVGGGDLRDNTGLLNDASQVYKLTTMNDILAWCVEEGRSFWEYVEFCEGKEIWSFLEDVWEVMKDSIARGLEEEGVLPGTLRIARKAGSYYIRSKTTTGSTGNIGLIFAAALAVAEENAASGKVVTAPTCGASGVVPAVLYFLKVDQEYSDKRIIRGLATAGLIGNIVKTNGSISGAEVGCQGELGTACAMAAGAAAQIMGGTPKQVEYAAEMGFEHNLGLTCDPVDGYVQIPCIERNAFISQKARECAVYSLFSDGSHKVSFDQVVETMMQTGKDLQSKYRETSLGGLARIVRPVIKKG
ncbi:L-serine ammonia-lyase [Ancylomarina subtilis]|uniref:L-serine dehydratase n=1 Tax=Ancylomarina subtilis TaxID=1639035 RepID=A0A4Q7VIF5_9BACT|nr:L-serine ammonia-lyase [Ancylomarina subtilis]RZT95926.1 L-serine ammonia-lyase [Ancylomarina subtilis]